MSKYLLLGCLSVWSALLLSGDGRPGTPRASSPVYIESETEFCGFCHRGLDPRHGQGSVGCIRGHQRCCVVVKGILSGHIESLKSTGKPVLDHKTMLAELATQISAFLPRSDRREVINHEVIENFLKKHK